MRECWDKVVAEFELDYCKIPHFGAFQTIFASKWQRSFNLTPIRDVFWDYLIERFPYAPGTNVLGQVLETRRVHSVISAQREIGSRAKMFHQRLIKDGFAIPTQATLPRLIKPLRVDDFENYAKEFDDLIYEMEAAEITGITVETFRLLAKAKLIPASQVQRRSKRRAFQKSDLKMWLTDLIKQAPAIQNLNSQQAILPRAPVILNCDLVELIRAMVIGNLFPVGLFDGRARLDHFVIDLDAARDALPRPEMPNGMKRIPTFRMLRVTNATLNYLLEHGYLEAFKAAHPATRRQTAFICKYSIEKFNRSYVSRGVLANSEGAIGGPQFAKLNKQGMRPFIDKPGLSKIYRRQDVLPEYRHIGRDLKLL